MKKSILWLGVLMLFPLGCGKKAEAVKEPEPVISIETAMVAVKRIRELLPVDGSYVLAAGDFAKLSPVTGGKLIGVFVKDGDRVRQGQLLARIDTQVLDAQRSSANAGSAAAIAQANQSETSLRASQADYEASVKAATLNLQAVVFEQNSNIDQARVELDRLRAGARPQEVSQAQQTVRQAQVNRDKAYIDAERDKKLLVDGYVSGQQADASKLAYDVAESTLVQAKDQLALVKLGARPEDIKAAELKLRSARELGAKRIEVARASLDQARKSKLSLDAKSHEAKAARHTANSKLSDSVAARGLAANGEIRAPFDGVIVRRLFGPGSVVDATTPVLEIAKRDAKIEFAGQTSPRNAGLVSEGMAALAEGVEEATGFIRSVGVADPVSGQVPIRIVFQSPPSKVSAGGFARMNIQIRKISQALVVPESAVVSREDKKVVFIVEGGVAKMHEVTIGPAEGDFVSITKGVKLGEKVVLVGNHELSDGAKVEEPKKEEPKKDDEAKK
jgi:RND family efflux transporter MFP subunit